MCAALSRILATLIVVTGPVWAASAAPDDMSPAATDDTPAYDAPVPVVSDIPIANPDALKPYFEALTTEAPVRVLHVGDSHIARDTFSGDLRALIGEAQGDGARGMVPAGLVYPFFEARGVELDMSEGWEVMRARDDTAEGPFGLMNARVEAAAGADPWIALSGFEAPVDRLLIGYLRQAGGGAIQVRVGTALHAVPTAADDGRGTQGPAFAALPVPAGTQLVRLSAAGDGPVTLFSLILEADGNGAVLSNSGWPGATAEIMARWDDDLLRLELARLAPDLIIVSYGTNEGFDDALDLAAYETVLRAQLARLRTFAPGAAILLTGGPDGTRLPFYADTDAREFFEWSCTPLSDVERQNYDALIMAESESLLRWHDPPMLDALLALQRRVGADMDLAHWNWRKAMGGPCAVHDWRLGDPQWARPDHVHLTGEGYAASARALKSALNGAFVAWQQGREGSRVP